MLVAGYALITIGTACLACGLFVLWLGSLSDDRNRHIGDPRRQRPSV